MQSKQVCVQLSTSADNVALPAFADEHRAAVRLLLSTRQQPIDTFCLPGPQQQTRSCKMRCTNEIDRLTDKQTGGWTLYHYTDPAPHRMKKHVMMPLRWKDWEWRCGFVDSKENKRAGSSQSWSKEGTVRHRQSKETSILCSHHEETRELPGERDNARNNARCTQARKTTRGLDG